MPLKRASVFVDESGDLGFDAYGSSRHLVLAAMVTSESDRLERLTKKARRRFGKEGGGVREFKFNSSPPRVRRHFLYGVAASDALVVWGAVDKQNAPEKLRRRKEPLYQHVCGRVLAKAFRLVSADMINVVIDRRSDKWFRDRRIADFVSGVLLNSHSGYFAPELKVSLFDPRKSSCLQVNDFVVGSIFQKVERLNEEYYRIIEGIVRSGEVYW